MQLPIIAHRGQVKPYGSIPRINWLHPLTAGLISYGYDVGCGPIDLVKGGQRTITNTGTPFGGPRSSKYGSGLTSVLDNSHATTTSLYTLPGSPDCENFTVAAPYSIASGFMLTTTPGSGVFNILYSLDDGVTTNLVRLSVAASATTDLNFVLGASGTQTIATSLIINSFQTMLGVATTAAAAALYVDGVLKASPAATMTKVAAAGSKPTFVGNRTAAVQNFPAGFIYYGALWEGRALTASEARLLHDDPYCFLIYPEDEMFASLIGTARHLQPDVDSSDGSWTNELGGTVLFSSIDEISVADDTTYIQSSNNPSSDICKISLSDPSTTSLGSPLKVRYRYKKKDNSPTAADLTVRLLQGVTQITSWSHTGISTSFVTTEQTLSASERASITDFTDLYLEFTANS